MPSFKIEITETLQRTVTIEAEDLEQAIEKVEEQCNDETINLDWSDFITRDIKELEQ